jgi:Fe-S-cluster containining protein
MKNKCENCGICCFNTEMILFKSDIEAIIKNSNMKLERKEFSQKNEDGIFQLINIEGHCFFFDTNLKTCKIYANRPQGCQFYPLIYNLSEKECIIDDECPRPHLFYQDKKSVQKTCQDIKKYLSRELNLD